MFFISIRSKSIRVSTVRALVRLALTLTPILRFYAMKQLIIILSFSSMTLFGCADNRAQLAKMENAINDLRGYQADQTTQIAALQTEVRRVSGRLDEIEYQQKTRLGSDLNSLKDDLSRLKTRVPPPAQVPIGPLEEDEAMAGRLPSEISKNFIDGLLKVREGAYNEAIPLFQQILDSTQPGDFTANVLFWIGVCYDGNDENRQALTSYSDIVARFPKHSRAPQALLRQSAALVRLGDSKTAKLSLQKLLQDYPKSAEAVRARERLKDLG